MTRPIPRDAIEAPRYWFRAKRYGWGWGLPLTWEGWVVMVASFVFLGVGTAVFLPRQEPALVVGWTLALSAALVFICWRKGQPARWRWGED